MQSTLMLKSMDNAASECVILRKQIPAGRNTLVHWHDYFELELVTSGTTTHILNDTKYSVTSGGAYLLTPNDFHSFYAESDVELINIRFNDTLLPPKVAEYLQSVGHGIKCSFDNEGLKRFVAKIDGLENEISSAHLLCDVNKTSILSQIIIEVLRSAGAAVQSKSSGVVQKAAAYVLKNFRDDISLTHVAEYCSVTPNYLGVRFKKHTGKSFSHYLNTTRLKYACNLLVSTSLSVKEIAFSSGYNSVEYFLSVFEKNLHIYPTEYRRLSSAQ